MVTLLTPPGHWATLDLQELWMYRELLIFLVWKDLKIRYKQTVIGIGWAALQPLFMMAIFSLFFGYFAKLPSNGLPYPVFYLSGLVLWMYVTNTISIATNSIVENQKVITKVYFPRLLLPGATVLSGLVDFSIAFVLLVGVLLWYGISLPVSVVAVPGFLLVAILLVLGISLWLSALNAVYRDVRHAIPFIVQLWMFVSPVAYPSSVVPGRWQWLYGLNPLAGIIEGFRWALTGSGQPPGLMLIFSTLMGVVVVLSGYFYFCRMENTIADVV